MKTVLLKKIFLISAVGFLFWANLSVRAISIWDEFGLDQLNSLLGGNNYSSTLGNNNPTASQDTVDNLSQSNLNIANDEAQALWEIQNADFEACSAEGSRSSGSGSSGSGNSGSNSSGSGSSPNDSSPTGSGGTLGGNEQSTRDALAEKGISINNSNNCGNLSYQEYRAIYGKSCTSVAGMPQEVIDYLGGVNSNTGGGLIVTGGTEKGHSAHFPGAMVVDVDNTPKTDTYLEEHTISTWGGTRGTWHQLDDGSKWLDEGDHYHVVVQKSNSTKSTVAFGSSKNNLLQFATSKVQTIFSWFSKKIKRVSLINIAKASNNVNLGGQSIDPTSISTEQLEEIISNLSQSQINSGFSQMNQSALSQLTSRMSFNSINTVLNSLTGTNVNSVVSTLGGSGFNNIADLLTEEASNNIFSNLSVSGFDSLTSGINNGALETLVQGLDSSGVDNLLLRANDDVLENIFENLGVGGINNLVYGGSEDLLRGAMNSLDTNQLEQIFGNVGISMADKLVDSLGSNFLNEIIPELDSSTLNNLFGNLGSNTLNNLVDNLTSGNWENILASVTGTTANDLVTYLGSEGLNNLIPGLSDSALNDLFDGLGSDTIADLADVLTDGNWNNVLDSLGGDILNQTLESLGGNFGDILPGLEGSTIIQMFTQGDSDLLGNLFSGVSGDIAESALDLIPSETLEQFSDIPVVGEFLGGNGLGGLAGLVSGGLYVPVVEQNGQLMTATKNIDSSTKSIDTTTQDIRDLSIQICTHLRAIRRIQTSFETMKIADEANANRTRLEAIAKYANDIAGSDNPDSLAKTGYKTIVDGQYVQKQVFPQNLDEHMQEKREEAKQIALADVKNSKNLYRETLTGLIEDETLTNLDSTLTKEEIAKFKKADQANSLIKNTTIASGFKTKLLAYLPNFIIQPMSRLAFWKSAQADEEGTSSSSKFSADDFWNVFLKATDPENNPYGSAMLAMQKKESAQNKAEALARDEYIAAQGILPTGRECIDEIKDEEGNLVACRKWVVTVGNGAPGIIVRDTLGNALSAKLQTYLVPGGPESQPEGSAPNAHEAATAGYKVPTGASSASGQNNKTGNDGYVQVVDPNKTSSTVQGAQENSGSGQTTGGFGDANGGTGSSNPDETGGGSSLNWGNLLSQLSSLWSNDDGTSSGNEVNAILAAINTLLGSAQNAFQSQEPLVQTKVLSPTLAQIKAGKKINQVKLVWATPNSTCGAENSWLSRGEEGELVVVKNQTAYLGKSGWIKISLPIPTKSLISVKNEEGQTINISPKTTTAPDYVTEKLTYDLSQSPVQGEITVTIDNFKFIFSASSNQDLITQLKDRLYEETSPFALSQENDSPIFYITRTNPIYKIECYNDISEIAKTIIIER